ncbi:MAG: hypothetical protein IKH51_03065 [Clostridia bacterium]|nr:hypothetical protein [Clostridia bacterium]
MKKIFVLILIPVLLLCSCGGKIRVTDMTPKEIIAAVYENVDGDDYMKELIPELITYEITKDNEQYYLGVSGIPYESGAASEAVVQPITYSFCVIRLKEGSDYDAERIKIEANINKSKWVCAKAEEAYVVRCENLIAVIMGPKSVCDLLENEFLTVVKK